MSTDSSSPQSDANLSGLGRLLLGTNEGSKPSSGPWVPPTAEELHAILPQYEIVKMLGRGGMGAVYMGRQTALDRPVAIKILSAQLEESNMGFTERFKNEARAMGKLNHPAIVSVYEFGQHESGLLYIVMEYVDGTDVAKMIAAKGRLHTEHAMAITAHVCDALAYAHERGIIHRDIKPANIMVGYDGMVKVADFGLAKVNVGGQTIGLTQSGMAMGTLHFMAPEALMLGTSVDHRADIYAVGVMLYQMLTGKLPQGMFKMPSLQVPGLDPRYDGIIAKAMMEDREARYQSAREMRGDLDGILTQPVVRADPEAAKAQQPVLPTQARPQRPGGKPVMRPAAAPSVAQQPPPRGTLAWLWVTVLVVAVLGGVALLIQPKGKQDQPNIEAASDPAEPPSASQPSVVSATTTNPVEATKERPFVNSLGMKFVPVPIIGGPSDKQQVLFNVWETRVRDYAVFAKETSREWPSTSFPQEPSHPAVKVSWDDALAFCVWLTERERRAGRIGDSDQFRLPSDHEWSCAMGLGAMEVADAVPAEKSKGVSAYPWDKDGKTWPPPAGAGNYAGEECQERNQPAIPGYRDAYIFTSPVGAFPANPFGLNDLSGNAAEWCADWFDETKKGRVFRGGSWGNHQNAFILPSSRENLPTNETRHSIGFRVVLVLGAKVPPVPVAMPSAPPAASGGNTAPFDSKLILGRWTRTNMDRAGEAYLMDLFADGSALWTGDNTTVRGTWLLKPGILEVDWNSRFKFLITPPTSSSSEILKGTANWPDGKSTEIAYERQAASPSGQAPSSVATWIDTKGRSLQAKFVRVEGTNVLLDIAGTVAPVAMSTLSNASQQQARHLQSQLPAVPAAVSVSQAPSVSPPPAASPPPLPNTTVITPGWRPMFPDEAALRATPGVTQLADGWWRFDHVFFEAPAKARNLRLRVHARFQVGTAPSLIARWDSLNPGRGPSGDYYGYQATFYDTGGGKDDPWVNGIASVSRRNGGVPEPGGYRARNSPRFKKDLNLRPGDEYDMEFELVGENFKLGIDGQEGTLAGFASCPGSGFGLFSRGAVEVSRMQWQELDEKGKVIPATPPDVLDWTDTHGKALRGQFKGMDMKGNVLLDLSGRITPVPWSLLSPASQRQVRAMHAPSTLSPRP